MINWLCSSKRISFQSISGLFLQWCHYPSYGAFINYVDNSLTIIFHLTTPVDFFYFCKVKYLCTINISSTTYLSRLVNIVKECPLTYRQSLLPIIENLQDHPAIAFSMACSLLHSTAQWAKRLIIYIFSIPLYWIIAFI